MNWRLRVIATKNYDSAEKNETAVISHDSHL